MEQAFPKLSAIKKMIVNARRSGVSFWEISEDGVAHFTDRVIILTGSITGCEIPQMELTASALSDEIVALLNDFGYYELTLEEVILAVRLNFWPNLKNPAGNDFVKAEAGVRVNTAFLGQCLYNYKVLRNVMETEFANKLKGY